MSNVCRNRPDLERELYNWRKCVLKSCFEGSTNSDGLKPKHSFKFEKKFPLVGYPEITYEELYKIYNWSDKTFNYDEGGDLEKIEAEALSFFSDHPIDFKTSQNILQRMNTSGYTIGQIYGYSDHYGKYGSRYQDHSYFEKNYSMRNYEIDWSFNHDPSYNNYYTKWNLNTFAISGGGYYHIEPTYLDFKYDYWAHLKNYAYNKDVCLAKEGKVGTSYQWLEGDLSCANSMMYHYGMSPYTNRNQYDSIGTSYNSEEIPVHTIKRLPYMNHFYK